MSHIKSTILVWQTLLGHYRLHRAQGVFLLLGLSLGVAILLGTLLLNHAATDAFERARSTIGGQVIASIIPTNGAKTFDERIYTQLRKKGHDNLMPVIEGAVILENRKQISLQGLDIVANLNRDFGPLFSLDKASEKTNHKLENQTAQVLPMVFSYPPYQLLVSESQAKLLQFKQQQQLTTLQGKQLPKITIVSDDFGIDYNLVCDIRCAQDILGQPAKLSSLILLSESHNQTKLLEDLKQLSQGDLALVSSDKNPENKAMSDAFFLNITAVSMLAFLVGCFIAFNAVRFSIDERLKLVQRLRLLGVSNTSLMLALLLELITWALLASVVGGILGFVIANNLSAGVGLTVRQLFGGTNILAVNTISQWYLQSLYISLIATLLATIGPFYQLSRQKPLETNQTLNHQTQNKNSNWQWIIGLVLLITGSLLTKAEHNQSIGFTITFCWFIGVALLTPKVLNLSYALLSKTPQLPRYPKLHWAIEDSRQHPERLSIAMMAFTVAIAASIGVNTMVSSFQKALENHLDLVLAEDIYLSPNDAQSPAIFNYLTSHPDVALAYRFLSTTTKIDTQAQQPQNISVRTISNHSLRHNSLNLAEQTNNIWQQFHAQQGVIINQTLAMRFNLALGDKITFNQITTKVIGIYYNYGSPKSAIAISHNWFKTLWPNVQNSEIGVFIKQASTDTSQKKAAQLITELKNQFQLQSHHYIEPQGIKYIALTIFKQTFNVTQLLIVFTLIIAAIGIYCACYAAQLNNLRQLTLLKVLGVNQRQLVGLSVLQLGFNALIAALIAIPLGLVIAWASVAIVLQYSFGWHFPIVIEEHLLIAIAIGAIFIALIAGAIPLYQQSRKTAMSAFREAL